MRNDAARQGDDFDSLFSEMQALDEQERIDSTARASDFPNAAAAGAGDLVGGIGWLFDSETLENLGSETGAFWQSRLSEAARQDMAQPFVEEGEDGGFELGSGFHNPRTWALMLARSAPAMVPGLASGAGAARLTKALGGSSRAASTAAAAAGSATEGATTGGFVGQETKQAVMDMPKDILEQSPFYQDLLKSHTPEKARKKVAEKAAEAAAMPAGVMAAILGVAANKFLGDAVLGRLQNTRGGNAIQGAMIEGSAELGQGTTEAAAREFALAEHAGKEFDPTAVANESLASAGLGTAMGAGIGAAAPAGGNQQAAPGSSEEGALQTFEDEELAVEGQQPPEPEGQPVQTEPGQPDDGQALETFEDTDDFGQLARAVEQADASEGLSASTTVDPGQGGIPQPTQPEMTTQTAVQADVSVPQTAVQVDSGSAAGAGQGEKTADGLASAIRRPSEPVEKPEAQSGRPPQGLFESLQNRDRGRAAMREQVESIARDPDYNRVSISRDPATGAPMVFGQGNFDPVPDADRGRTEQITIETPNGDTRTITAQYAVVEGDQVKASHDAAGRPRSDYGTDGLNALNNGRMIGLTEAQRRGTANTYTNAMMADESHGVPQEAIAGKENPVLVRLFDASDLEGIEDIGAASNIQPGADLSASEQARSDARLLDSALLDRFRPGDIDSQANSDFVSGFVGQMAPGQANEMMTGGGLLTKQGRDRIEGALVARAYGDPTLVADLTENLDDELRSFGQALVQVAGQWAKMRDLARDGAINPAVDITEALVDAVNMIRTKRQRGTSLADQVAQMDAFSGDTNRHTVKLLELIHKREGFKNIRRRDDIVAILSNYAQQAMQTSAEPDLMGEITGPDELLEALRGREPETLNPEQGLDLGGPATGAGGTDPGRGTERRAPEATGQGLETEPGAPVDEAVTGQQPEQPAETGGAGDRRDDPGQKQSGQEEPEQGLELTQPTPEDLERQRREQEEARRKEREAEQRARADEQLSGFQLVGSQRPVDANSAGGSQQDFLVNPQTGQDTDVGREAEEKTRKAKEGSAKESAPDGLSGDRSRGETHQPSSGAERAKNPSRNTVAPEKGESKSLDEQASQADTDPSPAQIEAGNYQKGHITLHGLDISIENPRGSARRGTDPDGNQWERTLAHHYGYIRRTDGADGDQVDVFVGRNTNSKKVFVVDQVNPDGSFDEHKVMLGFKTKAGARKGYKDNYERGWKVGPITEMTLDEFKAWLKDGDQSRPIDDNFRSEASQNAPQPESEQSSGDVRQEGGYPVQEINGVPTYKVNEEQLGLDFTQPLPDTRADTGGKSGNAGQILGQRVDSRQFVADYVKHGLPEQVVSASDAAHVLAPFRKNTQETVLALVLDAERRPLGVIRNAIGQKDAAAVDVASMMENVVSMPGAQRIWLAHNHPSGRMEPSGADMALTKQIASNASELELSLEGHVLLGIGQDSRVFGSGPGHKITATAAARKYRIPILERRFTRRDREAVTISRPEDVADLLESTMYRDSSGTGFLLLNNSHNVNGFLDIGGLMGEDGQLRETPVPRRFLEAAGQTGASAVIPVHKDTTGNGGKILVNMARMVNRVSGMNYRVLDGMLVNPEGRVTSLMQTGQDITRENDPFFSRKPGKRKPLGKDRVQSLADRIAGQWSGAPSIQVVENTDQLPERIAGYARAIGAESEVRGVFWDGEVHLVADNIASEAEAQEVLLHEVVGHFGLRAVAGPELQPILNRIWASQGGTKQAKAIINTYFPDGGFDPGNPDHRATVAEELVAHMAEDNKHYSLVSRIAAVVQDFLRSVGFDIQFNARDIQRLLRRSHDLVANSGLYTPAPTQEGRHFYDHMLTKKEGAGYLGDSLESGPARTPSVGPNESEPKESIQNELGDSQAPGGTTLTGSGKSGELAPGQKMRDDLWRKHGKPLDDYLKEEFGYGIDSLTQGEAEQFRKAVSLDAIRDRVVAARLNQSHGPADESGRLSGESGAPGLPDVEEATDEDARRYFRDRPGRGSGERPRADRTVGGGRPRSPSWRQATRLKTKGAGGKRPAPIRLWRGAAKPLSPGDFAESSLGVSSGNPSAPLGVWFTTRKSDAQRYGKAEPFFLDVRRPRVYQPENAPSPETPEQARELVESLKRQGYDGIVIDYREVGGGFHAAVFSPDQVVIDESQAPRFSLASDKTPAQKRQGKFFEGLATQPLDRMFRLLFDVTGQVDAHGRWRGGVVADQKIRNVITQWRPHPNGKFQWLDGMLETARAGLIDRYGLSDEYNMKFREAEAMERGMLAEANDILKSLQGQHINAPEARVLQAVLTGEQIPDAEWGKVAAPIRRAIDDLGRMAVEYGIISEAAYQRNRGTYLHRSYIKHEGQFTPLGKWAANLAARKRRKIHGDAARRRGMDWKVGRDKLMRHVPIGWFGQQARADGKPDMKALNGKAFVILQNVGVRRDASADLEGLEGGGPPPRVRETVYWPADLPMPARYDGWKNKGTWHVRAAEGSKVILHRDYTKAERESMGEILDARYNIARTFETLSHDIAMGKFFHDISQNSEWFRREKPDGVVLSPREAAWLKNHNGADWVEVPNSVVEKSGGTKQWGALAGGFVRPEIWRDLNELDKMHNPGTWRKVLTSWKLMKTARSPVVHMNNVMSNLMLMDMVDVRAVDLMRAIKSFNKKDSYYQDAAQHGAFEGTFVNEELRREVLEPMLAELAEQEARHSEDLAGKLALLNRISRALFNAIKVADRKMTGWYQAEDELFRMATYMRRLDMGDTPEEAALMAREQFLDYDIRAPWVNAARRTVIPFIAYTYRAVPVVAQSIMHRPWKLAKYATIAYLVNALGYALEPGDEDEERRTLRDIHQGYTWLGTPRMIRMPARDEHGNPLFLDVRRWVPAGDVFDTNQGTMGNLGVPAPLHVGGPLLMGFELALNKQAFTGGKIFEPETDTGAEIAGKVGDWAYKSWMPSAAWVPGSWYFDKVWTAGEGGRDILGRPYSVPQALLSSVGIKLQPHDVKLGYYYKRRELDYVRRKLMSQARQLQQDRQRNLIDQDQYEAQAETIKEKLLRLQHKADVLAGRAQ